MNYALHDSTQTCAVYAHAEYIKSLPLTLQLLQSLHADESHRVTNWGQSRPGQVFFRVTLE